MNASLPTLPFPTENPAGGSVMGVESNLKQVDSLALNSFGPLLSEAHTAISPQSGPEHAMLADAENLIQQLQSLPQGGKLLPLLEQAMDTAVAAGLQQLLDQISANLEQLPPDTLAEPAAAIVAAVQQVVHASLGVSAFRQTQAAEAVSVEGKSPKVHQVEGEVPGRTIAQQIHKLIASAESRVGQTVSDVAGESKNIGVDRALAQLQSLQADLKQQGLEMVQTPLQVDAKTTLVDKPQVQSQPQGQFAESRQQVDLATVMAVAFKRQTTDVKPAQTDTSPRLDSLTASLSPATSSAQVSSTTTSALPTVSINTPFNQGNWDQAVGERIQWMVGQKMQGAQIKLNPAHLGPMEVRIQVQNDQASIQFTSAHTVVREALEAALPRLRDMFESSGVELVDVDVSGQSFAEQQRTAGDNENGHTGAMFTEQQDVAGTLVETPLGEVPGSGILDLFA